MHVFMVHALALKFKIWWSKYKNEMKGDIADQQKTRHGLESNTVILFAPGGNSYSLDQVRL